MNATPFSQKVGAWLLEKSGCSLVEFCHKFNYPPRETKIMGLDETDEKKSKIVIAKNKELKELYIAASKDPCSVSRKGENRSFTQYFKDLITGWILEDLTMEMLRRQRIDIEHNGTDRERVIALGKSVSQDADFIIKVGDSSRLVEFTNEFNHVLENNGFLEKRCPSLVNLHKAKGIWVYHDLPRGKYVLVDFATEPVHLHLRHHNTKQADWSKDVNRYVLAENGKKERDDRLFVAEIITVVGCGIEGKEQPSLEEVEDEDSPPQVFTIGGVLRDSQEQHKSTTESKKIRGTTPQKKEEIQKPLPLESDEESIPTIEREIDNDDDIEIPMDMNFGDGDFV